MSKKGFVIGVIAAVVVFSEIVTPLIASYWLDSALSKAMPARQHNVSARSFPGVSLWTGRFDGVTAASENANIDGLKIQEARVTLKDAQIDMGNLMRNNRITVQQVRDLEIVMKINEKDLAEYLGAKVKEVKNPTVKILPDKIQIRSDVDLGIIKLAVGVDGKIIGDAQSIRFRSDRIEVKNTGGINFGALFGEIPLLDLTTLPFKASVRKIVMEPGLITLYADNH
ncbi:MAG TPA: DUF2993 domain-containing protein [Negativicutes bacterium]|nr:DUF2993 domain-containing protein [Negativicutes bacterium]